MEILLSQGSLAAVEGLNNKWPCRTDTIEHKKNRKRYLMLDNVVLFMLQVTISHAFKRDEPEVCKDPRLGKGMCDDRIIHQTWQWWKRIRRLLQSSCHNIIQLLPCKNSSFVIIYSLFHLLKCNRGTCIRYKVKSCWWDDSVAQW